jgi:hypothetical protein
LIEKFRFDLLHQHKLRDRREPTAPLASAPGITPMRVAA